MENELEEVLRMKQCYEIEDGLKKREEIVQKLKDLVKRWIKMASLRKGLLWYEVDQVG